MRGIEAKAALTARKFQNLDFRSIANQNQCLKLVIVPFSAGGDNSKLMILLISRASLGKRNPALNGMDGRYLKEKKEFEPALCCA